MLKSAVLNLFEAAASLNKRNILDLVGHGGYEALCDLGCDDGEWTSEIARHSGSATAFGLEIVSTRARVARSRGINTTIADLADLLPFEDESFDLVHSNQVIEHMPYVDRFLSETWRILRTGGVAISLHRKRQQLAQHLRVLDGLADFLAYKCLESCRRHRQPTGTPPRKCPRTACLVDAQDCL